MKRITSRLSVLTISILLAVSLTGLLNLDDAGGGGPGGRSVNKDFTGYTAISTIDELVAIGTDSNTLDGNYYLANDIVFGPGDDLNGGVDLTVAVTLSGTTMTVKLSGVTATAWEWYAWAGGVTNSAVSVTDTITLSSVTLGALTLTLGGRVTVSDTVHDFAYSAQINTASAPITRHFNSNGNFNPIGTMSSLDTFSGILDGNGHRIVGMNIAMFISSYETFNHNAYAGLFKYLHSDGKLFDLGMTDGNVVCVSLVDNTHTGSLVGWSAGTVAGCYSNGMVSAASRADNMQVGGVLGGSGGPMDDCYNTGTVLSAAVAGHSYTGGVAGSVGAQHAVTGCYNAGTVNAIGRIVTAGGVVGLAYSSTPSLDGCYNASAGSVTARSSVNVAGVGMRTGGVVGETASATSITGCYNEGNVSVSGYGEKYAGGVAGYSTGPKMSECHNTGTVTTASASSGGTIRSGGVAGYAVLVTDCYNEGFVSAPTTASGSTGGVAGSASEVFRCHNTGEVTGTNYGGGVVGTTAKVSQCYNEGRVSSSANTGGVAGQVTTGVRTVNGIIKDCYNTGTISAAGGSFVFPGGVVGDAMYATVSNCYNIGTVLKSAMWEGAIAGHVFAGDSEAGGTKIVNCYFLPGTVTGNRLYAYDGGNVPTVDTRRLSGPEAQIVGTDNPVRISGGDMDQRSTTKTDTQMRPSLFSLVRGMECWGDSVYYWGTTTYYDGTVVEGWDFFNIWTIDPDKNNGYPIFGVTELTEITINVHGDGIVYVAVPGANNCRYTGRFIAPRGLEITFIGQPATDWVFNHWTHGSEDSKDPVLPVVFTLAADVIDAFFTNTTITLVSGKNPAMFGDTVTFTATVVSLSGGPATGTVSFYNDGVLMGTGTLDADGIATLGAIMTEIGVHPITAVYDGDAYHESSSSNTVMQLVKLPVFLETAVILVSDRNPAMSGDTITFTARVISASGTPTGKVQFHKDGVLIGESILDGNGVAVFATDALTVGTHNMTATYLGSDIHNISVSNIWVQAVEMPRGTNTAVILVSGLNPSVLGDMVTFTATVLSMSGTPSGTIVFFVDGAVAATVLLDGNGVAVFATDALTAGVHQITASYGGDSVFNGSVSNGVGQVVKEPALADSATVVVSDRDPSKPGETVTFTATVVSTSGRPSGSVSFFINGTFRGTFDLSNGIATFTTNTLTTGVHQVTATYSGDAQRNGSTSNVWLQTVEESGLENTATFLFSDRNPSMYGDTVTFTATVVAVTGAISGTVSFFDSDALMSIVPVGPDGTAVFTTSGLNVRTHQITATYSGDAGHNGSSSNTVTQVVRDATRNNTASILLSDNNPSEHGETVTFTVVAIALNRTMPSGLVSFFIDGTLRATVALGPTGVATYTTSSLSAGLHEVTATYDGDTHFNGSVSNLVVQVVRGPVLPETVVILVSDRNPSVLGEAVTFTATVMTSGGVPTGTVSFYDGAIRMGTGTLNADGTARFTTSSLTAGSHTIIAVYGGDLRLTASVSNAVTQVVNDMTQKDSAVVLVSDKNPSDHGDMVTFTATVTSSSGIPSGTVSFYNEGVLIHMVSLDADGTATFSTAALPIGVHMITASFEGDGFTGSVSNGVAQVVRSPVLNDTAVVLVSDRNPSMYGDTVKFTATVTSSAGIPAGTVRFYNGSSLMGTAVIDAAGKAEFSTSSLRVGTHDIIAVYGGDGIFNGSVSDAVEQVVTPASGKDRNWGWLWSWWILLIILIIEIITVTLIVHRRRYQEVVRNDPSGRMVGEERALKGEPYSFTAEGDGDVSYRVGEDGPWTTVVPDEDGVYTIPAEDVTDTLTIECL